MFRTFLLTTAVVVSISGAARADVTYTFDTDRTGWYRTGSGGSATATGGELVLTTTTTFQGIMGDMPSFTLVNPGDSIQLTFDFRFPTTAPTNSTAFRFGLYNQNGTPNTVDGGTAFQNDAGYFAIIPVGISGDTNTRLYGENPAGTVIAGTSLINIQDGSGKTGLGTGPQVHTGLFTITKSASGIDLLAKVDGTTYYSAAVSSPFTTTFDQIVFTYASAVTMNFDNVVVVTTAVPEPSSAFFAGLAIAGGVVLRRRRSSQTAPAGIDLAS